MTTLVRGSTGAAVRSLQERLNAAGFECGAADGDFGPKTQAAVKLCQERLGDEDGEFGPATDWMLAHASELAPQPALQPTADKIVAVARKYLAANVRERPDGSNKGGPAPGQPAQYSVDALQKPFGLGGQPWCGMFCYAVLKTAGVAIKPGRLAAARAWVQDAPSCGWSCVASNSGNPRPGDIFVHVDAAGSAKDHVGLVVSIEDTRVVTIEGNSANAVTQNRRSKTGYITHYVRVV